jgi:hypothetical protein
VDGDDIIDCLNSFEIDDAVKRRFTLNATDTSCASVSRNSPLHLSRTLYKSTFLCKTNPILSAVGGLQMNVSIYLQTAYENKSDWTLGQSKPNSNPIQTQFKPKQSLS